MAAKGPNHYNWKGGKPWKRFKDPQYIAWRIAVLQRDNYICQDCRRQCKKLEKGLAAHHLKSYAKFPESRFDVSNGLTLCRQCHMTLHKRAPKPKTPIPCKCGCGMLIAPFDVYGRKKDYVNHHYSRGKPKPQSMKDAFSLARKGKKHSEEHKKKISEGLQKSKSRIGRPPKVSD